MAHNILDSWICNTGEEEMAILRGGTGSGMRRCNRVSARTGLGPLEKDWKKMSENVSKAREGLRGWLLLGKETLPIRG